MHWFVRWFIYTWAVHFTAQVFFIFALVDFFALTDALKERLAANRPLGVFILVVHFTTYLLTELTSSDVRKIRKIERESLSDD